jgi:hypothetical protein
MSVFAGVDFPLVVALDPVAQRVWAGQPHGVGVCSFAEVHEVLFGPVELGDKGGD